MNKDRVLKSKFLFSIYTFAKNENGELELEAEITENTSAANFYRDMNEAVAGGENIEMEVVNAKPERFQFNKLYARRDGKRAWVFLLDEMNESEN